VVDLVEGAGAGAVVEVAAIGDGRDFVGVFDDGGTLVDASSRPPSEGEDVGGEVVAALGVGGGAEGFGEEREVR